MKNFLFIISFLLLNLLSFGQLQLKLGTIKTTDRATAIQIGISYVRTLDSIWGTQELFVTGKNHIFTVNPQIRIETGTEDAFSSVEAKMTGLFSKFKTVKFEGLNVPDFSKAVQTFPISIGVESNNTFSAVNGIMEAGWVPYYQSQTNNLGILRNTKFGIFLQGGYKFKVATIKPVIGGAVDESLEPINSALLRAKGSFSIDTKKLINLEGLKFGLVGNADVWYDFLNNKFYDKIDAIGRFYLVENTFFDVIYSKGSGAPNFNQGDQYGVGLNIMF